MYTKNMVKQKKKRTKKYSGVDAAAQRPKVTKITATSRSPAGQWLYDKKKLIKIISTGLIIICVIVIIVSGIISLF